MKNWIKFQNVKGNSSRQAHADLPKGTYEREMGREGFFGPASHLYHKHPPTGWVEWEGPLKPRAFDLTKLDKTSPSPTDAKMVLQNPTCKYRIWQCDKAMDHLFRNGDGDDVLFIHEGSGELFCDFGHMSYRDGDYILIPRGTLWRIEPKESTTILMIEATNGAYKMPEKGAVGPHAIFDQAMFDIPEIDDDFIAQQTEDTWQVKIKKQEAISTVTYPFNPLDAVGWKGDNTVVRINWRDIRPLMSHRYHLPPSAHITFVADRFVICTFVPRPFETDEGALKIPFFHNNDDYDEVLFYHAGDFFSRDNIHPGMVTWHPAGFPHGPHPKALERAFKQTKEGTDEVAVMIDTRDPLERAEDAEKVEFKDYVNSWKV
jgi:homogentisate 1,2-dioxygenase